MYRFAKEHFELFVKENFDLNNKKISHKLEHTYYVVDNAKCICKSIGLDKENTELAMTIALLHDIGRFFQATQMKTFREDVTKYDHANVGMEFLFNSGKIRNFIETNEFDDIIKKAIDTHSEYSIKNLELSQRERLHCNIIRDADKVDSFRTKSICNIYTMSNISKDDVENSKISDEVYNDFINEKTILSKKRKTAIDVWISYIAFVFGLEFKISFELINKNNYINKLFDRFEYKNDNFRMQTLRNKALNYVNKKLKS